MTASIRWWILLARSVLRQRPFASVIPLPRRAGPHLLQTRLSFIRDIEVRIELPFAHTNLWCVWVGIGFRRFHLSLGFGEMIHTGI